MDQEQRRRVIIWLTTDLVERLDAWRYAQHIPTRAEAIRELLETGLTAGWRPARLGVTTYTTTATAPTSSSEGGPDYVIVATINPPDKDDPKS